MPTRSECNIEIERLHDCFVAWYTATVDEESFDRIADALAPDFEMVTPEGQLQSRDAVLNAIHSNYGRDDPGAFDIAIRNVDLREAEGGYATVRYEEWQQSRGGETGRISTVLFRAGPDTPGGLAWLDVHETWLD